MNIEQYVKFLGRIHFRENAEFHKENLSKVAAIVERVANGTYIRTMYVHRPTHIVLLFDFKDDREYLPLLEQILDIKLDKVREIRQKQLEALSKKYTRKPLSIRFPEQSTIDQLNGLIDAYEAKYASLSIHPDYVFHCLGGKMKFKPTVVMFQSGRFPIESYEAKKMMDYLGKEMPDTVFLINKKVPKIALNDFVVGKVNMKGKEAEMQDVIDTILKDGLKKSMAAVKKLNKQLDADIEKMMN